MSDSNWIITMVIASAIVLSLLGAAIMYSPAYNKGYKQGQLDYQKGIIEYKIDGDKIIKYLDE